MIRLRPAGPADRDMLEAWDRDPDVMASDPDAWWQWETELARVSPGVEMLIAELDGQPIGFLQIIDPAREESRYWGDIAEAVRAIDIWIGAAADRGRGHGTQMMRRALERCFADPAVTAILIDPLASNTRAHRFYERLGFRFVERRDFNGDDCFVYRLAREDYDGAV